MNETISAGIADFSGLNAIIDRFEQRDAFTDVVERMQSNMPFQHNLFEWYGAPGIGKTTLIKLLRSECDQRNIPWALVNFDDGIHDIQAYLSNPIKVVEYILSSLVKYGINSTLLDERITTYSKEELPAEGICLAYARMSERERAPAESNPNWLKQMRYVLAELQNAISGLSVKNSQGITPPVVLFIDGVDAIPELLTDWIEEFIVKPFVQSKQSMVVWSARNPRKWKRPEIRWDRRSEELRPFNEDEVRQQLVSSPRFKGEETLVKQLFKNVYVLTGGHPYAGAVLIEQLQGWDDVSAESVKKREQDLLKGIYETVIRDYALRGLSKEQRTALELCSMVRLIDTTTLQKILQECSSVFVDEKKWQRKDFDRLLFELRKTYLLRWEKSGWMLEPSMRHLMRNYYLSCAVDTFRKVNETALKVYQEWLSKYVDNRKLFIIEEIYHYASLQQINDFATNITDVLKERLEGYPEGVKQDPESWRITLVQLEGEIEHDEELAKLLGDVELQNLVAPLKTQLSELTQTVQKNE